jgi:F-box domain
MHRLRIGNASTAAGGSKFCKKPAAMPFRRRTESVSTVLSTTSSTMNGVESGKSDEIVTTAAAAENGNSNNPLLWLEQDCPSDILPKILAYCGPQQVAALAKTNTTWQARIVGQEPLWRVLCEELYKVRERKRRAVLLCEI